MAITVNLNQAHDMILDVLKARLVPMLHGSPAVGKSAIVKAVAEENGLKVIDLRLSQCDPVDLMGFPRIDETTGKAGYVPMETFPLESDEVPEGYNGWLLFLDEISSAPRGVQAAAYKLLYDREVGLRKLHDNVFMVGAGNLETDNAIVEPMSTALQSRQVHMEIHLDHEVWLNWAMKHGVDHRITSYVQFKPSVLYTFSPDHTDKTYASPRTWEFASRLIQPYEKLDHDQLALLAGTISEGVAREFIGFCKIYTELPTIQQVMSNPEGIRISDEPSILYALTGSIASHANDKTIDKLMAFVLRLPKEFQVVCLREVVRRDDSLLQSQPVRDWVSVNATELF